MLTVGQADSVIPSRGTRHYYDAVAAIDSDVHEYYRLFESPGLGHCWGGAGAYPGSIFDSLVDWVENGKAPDSLVGIIPADDRGFVGQRLLCPYPQKAKYDGTGDRESPGSYRCL